MRFVPRLRLSLWRSTAFFSLKRGPALFCGPTLTSPLFETSICCNVLCARWYSALQHGRMPPTSSGHATQLKQHQLKKNKKQESLSARDRLVKCVSTKVQNCDAEGAVAVVQAGLRGTFVDGDCANMSSSYISCVSDIRASSSAIKGVTSTSCFSWRAVSAALYACESQGKAELGLSLIAEVQARCPNAKWEDAEAERALAVVLRLQCHCGDAVAAQHMIAFMACHDVLRLRSASHYLQFCCTRRDRGGAMALYEVALKKKIELSLRDYVALAAVCVANAEPLNTLHFMLREMQDHVTEVSPDMVPLLEQWCALQASPLSQGPTLSVTCFNTGVAAVVTEEEESRLDVCSKSGDIRKHDKIGGITSSSSNGCAKASACPVCTRPLRGYPFSEDQRATLLHDLIHTVIHEKCKTRRSKLGFECFQRYIAERKRQGDTIDILIDGANLGYYGLSKWYTDAKKELLQKRGVTDINAADLTFKRHGGGSGVDVGVSYALIDQALTMSVAQFHFRRPLVILHERHCEKQNMTPEGAQLVAQWRKNGWLYCTSSGLNDDLCWLYAALELTECEEKKRSCVTTIHSDDPVTLEFPGGAGESSQRPLYVLTNDLMRDHHFRLLSPRCFTRWRDQHTIRFTCVRESNETHLRWKFPDAFTWCIQESAPGCWHIPVGREEGVEVVEETAADGIQPMHASRSQWVCVSAR